VFEVLKPTEWTFFSIYIIKSTSTIGNWFITKLSKLVLWKIYVFAHSNFILGFSQWRRFKSQHYMASQPKRPQLEHLLLIQRNIFIS